jgi:hypothetical protein
MSIAGLCVDLWLPKVGSPANNLRLREIPWWSADPPRFLWGTTLSPVPTMLDMHEDSYRPNSL